MATWKETIIKLLGYRLIPQDHALLIEGDGQIVRWKKGPGYVHRNPFTEQYGSLIRIGFGSTLLVLENVHSSDRIPVGIHVKVLYSFDPDKCSSDEMAIAMLSVGPEVLKQIVNNHCDQAIRHIAGTYTGEALCSGKNLPNFEEDISSSLRHPLEQFGVTLIKQGGVAVTNISISDKLKKIYEEAVGQRVIAETQKAVAVAQRDVAEVMASMPAEGVERMVRINFVEKLSASNSSIQLYSSPEELPNLPSRLLGHKSTIPTNGHQNGKSSLS